MIVKLLIEHLLEFQSLQVSKSTHVKMSQCWKSHGVAHFGNYERHRVHVWYGAMLWENLVLGLGTDWGSTQPPQLQGLARILKFCT